MGGARQGDVLMSVNGSPFFVAGPETTETTQRKALWKLVNDEEQYPVTFEFARPKPDFNASGTGMKFFSSENSSRFTIEVTAKSDLGVTFKKTEFGAAKKRNSNAAEKFLKQVSEGSQSSSPDVEYFQIGKLEGTKGPVRRSLLKGASEDRVGLGMR